MKIKKIILLLLIIFCLTGCVNIHNLSYEDAVNTLVTTSKKCNTYKQGFQFYMPKFMQIEKSGSNYVIFNSLDTTYYMYVDLVSYFENKVVEHSKSDNSIYYTDINYDGKLGYVEIKLYENDKYLIEIMYNYAKIEVMVDNSDTSKAIINSINILKSIKYDNKIIEKLLEDDLLTNTEEIFDMFENVNNNDNYLEIDNNSSNEENSEEIKDTDFLD